MSENSFLSNIFSVLPMKSSENIGEIYVSKFAECKLRTKWHATKVINNPSDWFWQNLNSLSFLLSFSCDLNQSIPPFYPKCNVHCSEYWKIESVLNSIHTQNIDSFVLLSLLDLFIGKDNFQYWWVETSIYFSFCNEKGVKKVLSPRGWKCIEIFRIKTAVEKLLLKWLSQFLCLRKGS